MVDSLSKKYLYFVFYYLFYNFFIEFIPASDYIGEMKQNIFKPLGYIYGWRGEWFSSKSNTRGIDILFHKTFRFYIWL